ncbi:uncharacterized protein LOC111077830 [Drosophila obscura]|uniref:uncharacterized protein LOC111077830 n=1 Tax=Drosophila obscura TaxID=7282 RepID=UPI000BA08B16|nr:uncharacterized protein LOC111077830 [Drosophila obscura]
MDRQCPVWIWLILILLDLVHFSIEFNYEFVMRDEDVLSECLDKPQGALNANGLFGFSETSFVMSDDGINLSGNISTVWDVNPKDRVQLNLNVLYFDRGIWQSTIFNMEVKDFCAVMYNEKQFWYKHWSKYISNAELVKDKCVTNAGTKFLMEPYLLRITLGSDVYLRPGQYRIILHALAFDKKNVMRTNQICLEIRGEFIRA